jgi:IS5 family transposase
LIERSGIKKISLKKLKSKLKKTFAILRTIGRRNKEVRQNMLRKIVSIGNEVVTKTKAIKDKVIAGYHKLLKRVVKQGGQVLQGTTIIENRIVSIFEPAARPIRRGKAGKSTEFGKVIQIQEDEVFVTNWQISGAKNDEAFLAQALNKHKKLFQKMPDEVATDRGYWSEENFTLLKRAQVKHICLPKKGKLSSMEKQRQGNYHFKKLQRWRAGGEAKISWLKRKFGLRRCLDKGEFSYGRWVGAGILANNLIVMAKIMA